MCNLGNRAAGTSTCLRWGRPDQLQLRAGEGGRAREAGQGQTDNGCGCCLAQERRQSQTGNLRVGGTLQFQNAHWAPK